MLQCGRTLIPSLKKAIHKRINPVLFFCVVLRLAKGIEKKMVVTTDWKEQGIGSWCLMVVESQLGNMKRF